MVNEALRANYDPAFAGRRPMPNRNFADEAAIEWVLEACNTFLDERQTDRDW